MGQVRHLPGHRISYGGCDEKEDAEPAPSECTKDTRGVSVDAFIETASDDEMGVKTGQTKAGSRQEP